MKETATEIHQQLPANKKRIIVIKVILAMAILLLAVPGVMILASSYFTNKGIMMDAYLMGHEYTLAVTDFYNKNGQCPNNQDIKVTISKEDTTGHIAFSTGTNKQTCSIVSTLKKLGASTDNKLLVLTKTFTTGNEPNNNWHCYSNASSWFLPKGCNSLLPEIIKRLAP